VLLAAAIVPGFKVRGFSGAAAVSLMFGVLNVLFGWLIFVVVGVATLGLAFLLSSIGVWLTNAILLKAVDMISDRLTIRGFSPALLGALVISLASTLGAHLLHLRW
jgi:uncharacterized membrane protein YvlD (DUF360 family)